jgi:hypothetical protein
MAIKPIQTIEGGPEYDPWATADQMERLIKSLTTSGISQNDAKQLISLLDDVKKGGKVDQQVLRQVLGNLKTGVAQDKQEAKGQDQQDKAERSFWKTSSENAKAATRAFKSANIADALRQTRDLGMVPIDSLSDAFVKVTSIVGAFGSGILGAANSLISSLGKIGAGLGKALGFLGGVIGAIGGLVITGISTLLGAIDGMGDVFFSLYNSGINLAYQQGETTHGLSNLAQAAADANLTIGEFGEFILENSRVAVAIGADAMGYLSKTVRKAMMPLGQLGLSIAETNEYMGDWLEMTRLTNTMDAMDRAAQAQGAQDYLLLITQLSHVTGKRRDQIAAELKEQSKDPDYQSWIQGIPDAIRSQVKAGADAMRGWFGQFGPEFGEDITRAMVTPGGLAVTKLGESLIQAGYEQEVAAMQLLMDQNKRGEISETEMLARLKQIKIDMLNNDSATQRQSELTAGMSEAHHAAVRLRTSMMNSSDATDKQKLELDKLITAMGNMENLQKSLTQTWTNFLAGMFKDETFVAQMDKIADNFQKIMADDQPLAQNLKKLATAAGPALVSGLSAISEHVGTSEFASIMGNLPNLFKSLGEALKGAVAYLRDLFFKSEEIVVADPKAIDGRRMGKKYTLKSGGEIMDGLKVAFTDLFSGIGNTITPIVTGIMSSAFTGIGNALLDSAKELFRKILNKASFGFLGKQELTQGIDEKGNKIEGETKAAFDKRQSEADDFAGMEQVAIYGAGGIIGYKLIKRQLRAARVGPTRGLTTPTAPVSAAASPPGRASTGAHRVVPGMGITSAKPPTAPSKWRSLLNKTKGLKGRGRGNVVMALLLGGAALAAEVMDLGDIDETYTEAEKHKEKKDVAESAGGLTGATAGAIGGAKIGAMIGVAGGPVGMAIGGILGSLIGGAAGWWAGEKAAGAGYDVVTGGAPNNTAPVATAIESKSIEHGTGEGSVAKYQLSARARLIKEAALKNARKQEAKFLERGNEDRAAKYIKQIKELEAQLGIKTKIQEKTAADLTEKINTDAINADEAAATSISEAGTAAAALKDGGTRAAGDPLLQEMIKLNKQIEKLSGVTRSVGTRTERAIHETGSYVR